MYELKRSKKIFEEVKIGDDILTVNISADTALKEFNKNFNAVVAAENQLKQLTGGTDADIEQAVDAYSQAVIGLLRLIFGEENTEKILTFYENNYVEMVNEVFPFVLDVILPKVKELMDEEKQKLAARYNRSQRRKLGL